VLVIDAEKLGKALLALIQVVVHYEEEKDYRYCLSSTAKLMRRESIFSALQ